MADTYFEEKTDKLVDYAETKAKSKGIYNIEDLKDDIYTEKVENKKQIDVYFNDEKPKVEPKTKESSSIWDRLGKN